jgi:acetyltransferase-like isoleucine patch superfamily enzyme
MVTNKQQTQATYWKYSWAKKIDMQLLKFPLLRSTLRRAFITLESTNNRRKVKGNNNQININESILKNTSIDICGDDNTIEIKSQTIIDNLTFYIRGSGHRVSIGSNCRFNEGGTIWMEDQGCRLVIGDNTFVLKAHISLTESNSSIEIGSNCMLSSDIDIRSGDSHSIIDLSTGERVNYASNIKIEDHVWIGAHAKILKGVLIAKNSVVGMGSIVTKNVLSNTVVAGIPAQTVKTNITWNSKRI